MIEFTTERHDAGYYIARLSNQNQGYMVLKDSKGWTVTSEVTGEHSFGEQYFKTKRQAYNEIIDNN